MHRLFRHFLAWLTCLVIFSATGTLDYFGTLVLTGQPYDGRASLLLTGLTNVVWVAFLCLVVLMPVTVIADYLFTRKWPVSFPLQMIALIPLLGVYLIPWSVFFGRLCLWFVTLGLLCCTIPLVVYWGVFKVTDRDYGN